MADDTFKKTTDDQYVSTTDDIWVMDGSVAVGKQDLTWALQAPVPKVYFFADEQTLAYSQNASITVVSQLPAKQDLAWSLGTPVPIAKFLHTSTLSTTWEIQAPSVSTSLGITITPSAFATTWTLKTISISTGDYFVDTDTDHFVDFQDRWGFPDEPSASVTVLVDKFTTAWSQSAPVVGFDRTVYAFEYLKNEAGFPIRDEAGNPIRLEGSMDDLTTTWSIQSPSVIKTPEIRITPLGFNLAWSLNSTVGFTVVGQPAALSLTYSQPATVPSVTIFPEKLDTTWTLNSVEFPAKYFYPTAFQTTWSLSAPGISISVSPSALEETYTVNAPTPVAITYPDAQAMAWSLKNHRITGNIARRSGGRQRSLLLGVYRA